MVHRGVLSGVGELPIHGDDEEDHHQIWKLHVRHREQASPRRRRTRSEHQRGRSGSPTPAAPNPDIVYDKASGGAIGTVELTTKNNQYVNCAAPESVKVLAVLSESRSSPEGATVLKNESVACGVGGFLTGALVGGVLAYKRLFDAPEDDDRPPIIVKGGSLIFQSGDPRITGDPKVAKGKPWTLYNGEWQPKHDNGKKTKWFFLELTKSMKHFGGAREEGNHSICRSAVRYRREDSASGGGACAQYRYCRDTDRSRDSRQSRAAVSRNAGQARCQSSITRRTAQWKSVKDVEELIVWRF